METRDREAAKIFLKKALANPDNQPPCIFARDGLLSGGDSRTPGRCASSTATAWAVIQGIEAANMIRQDRCSESPVVICTGKREPSAVRSVSRSHSSFHQMHSGRLQPKMRHCQWDNSSRSPWVFNAGFRSGNRLNRHRAGVAVNNLVQFALCFSSRRNFEMTEM